MFNSKNSKNAKAGAASSSCKVTQVAAAILLFLAMAASAVGVYVTHVLPGGLTFGSPASSLAIVAFVVSASAFLCQTKRCAGSCCYR